MAKTIELQIRTFHVCDEATIVPAFSVMLDRDAMPEALMPLVKQIEDALANFPGTNVRAMTEDEITAHRAQEMLSDDANAHITFGDDDEDDEDEEEPEQHNDNEPDTSKH